MISPWIAILNIVLPHVFQTIRQIRDDNPDATYKEALEIAGVKLDLEYAKLLEEMDQAVRDGAIPRTPPV